MSCIKWSMVKLKKLDNMIVRDIRDLPLNSKPFIIMLPYAGGNAYSYKKITDCISDRYNVFCPELPGRGGLYNSDLLENIDSIVDYLFNNWIVNLDVNTKYVIYGHSMGGIVAYTLVQKMKYNCLQLPDRLLISGREAPSTKIENPIHELSKEKFWEKLYVMGGMPTELISNNELKDFFEPIIRADIKAIETYEYRRVGKLAIPITILYGKDEDISIESLYAWKKETIAPVEFVEFEGNHFFINVYYRQIASCLIKSLNINI